MPWLLRRLASAIPTFWLAVSLSFAALLLVPGDPAGALLAPNAPPEAVEAERHALGLDEPAAVRYARYLAMLARGDLGTSWASRRPVAQLLAETFPATLVLSLAALALALASGIAVGSLAAWHRGSALDRGLMALAMLAASTPIAATGVLVLAIVAPAWPGAGESLVWPALVLALGSGGAMARLARAQLVEILGSDYLRTARGKGLAERAILAHHAIPNALIPVVSATGVQFGFLLGGAVLTEMIFSRVGMGRLLFTAILQQDLPVVQGVVALSALSYVVIHVLVDTMHAWLDPRLR